MIHKIHIELDTLNEKAVALANTIPVNFKELGI